MILMTIGLGAALAGVLLGWVLSKRAVEWCPTCGVSLAGHCPEELVQLSSDHRLASRNGDPVLPRTNQFPINR